MLLQMLCVMVTGCVSYYARERRRVAAWGAFGHDEGTVKCIQGEEKMISGGLVSMGC